MQSLRFYGYVENLHLHQFSIASIKGNLRGPSNYYAFDIALVYTDIYRPFLLNISKGYC